MDLAREWIAEADRMRGDRSAVDALRQEVRDLIVPIAQSMSGTREEEGAKSHGKVLDNSAETVHDTLVGAVVSTLTPDTIDWAGVKCAEDAVNEDDEAIAWFEICNRRMAKVFRTPKAGFFTTQHEVKDSTCSFGDGCKYIPFVPGLGPVFVTVPIDEVYIKENDFGRVDTVVRDFRLTARQAVQRFRAAAPPKVMKRAEDVRTAEDMFRFIHAVYPNPDANPTRADPHSRAFLSVEICVDEFAVVNQGGFHEMPFVFDRWFKRAGNKYGRGCGMKALADVKSLQRTMGITFRGAEKAIDPPLLVVDDGVLGPVRTTSNGITWVRNGTWNSDPVKALNTGARPDLGEELAQGIRERIGNAYFKDKVRVLRSDRMTATEYLGEMEKNNEILGPFLGRQKDEDIGSTVERTFAMMLRLGAFPPMPTILLGRDVDVDYVSPLVRQQKIAQARGFAQFQEITGQLTAARPDVLDNLDTDRIYRDTGDILSLPKSWFLSADQVAAARERKAKAMAEAQQQQQTLQAVDVGANAVRALPALKQAFGEAAE